MKGDISVKAKILALILALCAVPSYALSDAEYTQMMKDKNFAQADKQLTQAYRAALKTLAKNKTAQEKFRQAQREWIASGRDEDAEAMMGRYTRTRAYTIATRARAEDLPEIARKYLQSSTSSSRQTQTPTKTPAPSKSEQIEIDTRDYPVLGVCNASNVRLREKPDTKSGIVGSVSDGDPLIVLGAHYVPQSAWYYVDNPKNKGTAFIYAPYVDLITRDDIKPALYTLQLDLMTYYGMTPEKAKALFGNPLNEERESNYYDGPGREVEDITLQYPGFNLHYFDGRINHIDVTSYGHSFGDISIGTSKADLVKKLGTPSGEGDEGVTYEISERENFQFELRDDKVSAMEWNEYID